MTGLKLLETYPNAAKIIGKWFLEKMIESFHDEEVPYEFKEQMRKEGITHDKLGGLIDIQPRTLFDVFDDNEIYIEIQLTSFKSNFIISICRKQFFTIFITRKEAEIFAIEEAFKLLEENITENRMNIIGQNGNTGEHYEKNN